MHVKTKILTELVQVGGLTFAISLSLGILLALVHFFTRYLEDITYRLAILCGIMSLVGITWHIVHPLISPELEKVDVYLNKIIWIMAFSCAAYLTNKIIDKYVWYHLFVEKGQTLSTSFLRSFIAGFVYLFFMLMILWFVFNREAQHLATFITGSSLLILYSGKDVAKELFAGLALNLTHAFKKGDFLKIDDRQGRVVDIDWRYVTLEDISANLLFVPNTKMMEQIIYNYGGNNKSTRVSLSFRTHPNVPPQLVINLLVPKLKQLKHLAEKDWYQDNVVIHINNSDGYTIEFVAEILVDSFVHAYETKTTAYKIIWYTLNHNKIPLLSYEMRVNFDTQEYLKAPKLWHQLLSKKEIAALLKKSFLFSNCTKSEISLLSNNVVLHEFVPSQHLYTEGEEGDVLYLIKVGTIHLEKKMKAGELLITNILQEGDVVGVSTVMTGKKRERSAVAVTHVQAYAIKREILKKIIDKYHERVQHIADQIVYEEQLREKDFQTYLKKKTRDEQKTRNSIAGHVRNFLGISDDPKS